MPPLVIITDDTVTITKADGSLLTINKVNIVDASALAQKLYTASQSGSTAMDSVTNYKMALHLADNRVEVLDMGTVSDQATWENTVLGANQAVQDVFGGGTPPPPVFVCEGTEYGSFTTGGTEDGFLSSEGSFGYITYRNASTEEVITDNSGFVVLPPGTYCMWPSDASGDQAGVLNSLYLLAELISALDISNWLSLASMQAVLIGIPSIDLSLHTNLGTVDLSGEDLETVIMPTTHSLTGISFGGCGLSEATVNHVLANAVANGMTGGEIYLAGGTSAAPTGQGIIDKADLITAGNTVTTN